MLRNEEEFNNFMHLATEVHDIVKKITSDDTELMKMGMAEADKILNYKNEPILDKLDGKDIELTITSNRTMINKVKPPENENEQSPDAFMKSVELDAQQRFNDKKVRREKAETLKLQANKAFRRGEFEKSLSLYNKAIGFIRDSCVLYTNRALTYMQLHLFEKAIDDCVTALKLNENSLKAHLYLANSYYKLEEFDKSEGYVLEALQKHPENRGDIEKYVLDFKGN